MSKPLQIFSISAPGFYGLNTQDSPLDLAAGFASIATNCVIDQYGRIGSRKGWSKVNSSSGNLGANDVGVIHELVQTDGSVTTLFAGNNKLFKLSGTTVTELTYGGGGTAPAALRPSARLKSRRPRRNHRTLLSALCDQSPAADEIRLLRGL